MHFGLWLMSDLLCYGGCAKRIFLGNVQMCFIDDTICFILLGVSFLVG